MLYISVRQPDVAGVEVVRMMLPYHGRTQQLTLFFPPADVGRGYSI